MRGCSMVFKISERRELLHQKLVQHIEDNMPAAQASLIAKFIHQYYATVSVEDLMKYDLMDLYGALMSHWHSLSHRNPDEVKLKIYNPEYEKHGWKSTHTIIEISQDDMPFLVDSIQMELNRRHITTHMVIHVGGLKVVRDKNCKLVEIFPPGPTTEKCQKEAIIFFAVDRQADQADLESLQESFTDILGDVRYAVDDWPKMLDKMKDVVTELETNHPPVEKRDYDEAMHFLKWILDHHFTLIGYRRYDLQNTNGDMQLVGNNKTGLGVMRKASDQNKQHKSIRKFSDMTAEAQQLALAKNILIIAKTNTKATIHRPAYTDYIGVKIYDKNNNIIGEHRFIGLFTSAAYNRNPRDIPVLRRKVEEVMTKSHMSRTGHAGKALLNILENLPRDDLFQANSDELLELAMGILHLQERRMIKLFVRKDSYGRFISCLVYVPRDLYHTSLREKMQTVLAGTFNSEEISFSTQFSESVLARIHYMIRVNPAVATEYNTAELEQKLREIARTWEDDLAQYLRENNGEHSANKLISRYLKGFPAGYRENILPITAVYDIAHIDKLTEAHSLEMSLFKPLDASEDTIRFKLYTLNKPVPLSDVLPILENMGLRVIGEEPFKISLSNGDFAWISDFKMKHPLIANIDIDIIKNKFQNAFASIWFNEIENDAFNKLVLNANLEGSEIKILRAYAKYLRQIGFTYSQPYIEEVLNKYPQLSSDLVTLFNLRFTPGQKNCDRKYEEFSQKFLNELDNVKSLDEDRILRNYFSLINATLRTNYFQKNEDGHTKDQLSLKLESDKVPGLPLPKPLYEIFVYSPRVEGIHLRTAKVARGGLRWSDRREDFRTEVLGLVKAQKVKNSVIVPAGAKGGFVCKELPAPKNREEFMQEGIKCYKTFIRGLLDLADNIINDAVVPPSDTVRYDDDDPYLVVAADKGTATFSNYANEVSLEYGFWLGDAFASGGEQGYDHKKMGITARGAWEAVKRRFRELGINTQADPFTVVGIGDMMGDVFGNGMLLSRCIKLVGAFNHQHIFIDPNPDMESSYKERERLFKLTRSSWDDYDKSLISKGGGIFSRQAKYIELNTELKQLLDVDVNRITPNDMIIALLKAKIDLLWNGGIGTFVKASAETHLDVGDRNNEGIRINACELRTQVVGEGGNLGLTQLARIEFALRGGSVDTDFIDNSAGVDCSDHEVNIKILLNGLVVNGDLTYKQRNVLLSEMTEEVAKLVLCNNYEQTQAVSLSQRQAMNNIDLYANFIAHLEKIGLLNREIEFLPSDDEMFERKSHGKGLTRPEIDVLLSYSKIYLKTLLLDTNLPDDNYLNSMAESAFPSEINKRYAAEVHSHKLRREIVATQLSNAILNAMGVVFIKRLEDETGASTESIVRAYMVACEIFHVRTLWNELEALDYKVSTDIQLEIMLNATRLVRRGTRWILNNHKDLSDIIGIANLYKKGVNYLFKAMPELLQGTAKEYYENIKNHYLEAGVPEKTALNVSGSLGMLSAMDIVSASNEHNLPIERITDVYFHLGAYLELTWFRAQIMLQTVDNQWETLSKAAFRDDIDWQQRELTIGVILHNIDKENTKECIETWMKAHQHLVNRWNNILSALRSSQAGNQYVMYIVAIRALLDLTKASMQAVKNLSPRKNNMTNKSSKKPFKKEQANAN